MITIITILILLACVVLAFFILVQNPKGGGLQGSFGSVSSQVMGVKQSSDVMEKGTWTLIGIVCGLSILSVMFFQKPEAALKSKAAQQKTAPAKAKK
ncbi:hypothetical protein GCM10023093_05150 [Nemorincola caseinilytica]|uniref:Protein-export membrane protein SecG n=1 Tax=Nemorincola caseinilytica TaxID=2054315 RepID=A0ABP8N4D1_9BACT